MPKFNEYLTLKEVQELLPTEFSPTKLIDKIQKLYESPKGIILFKEAKIKDSNESQYGVKKETVLNYKVSYVCLTVGFNGILLIPSELLINYFDENDTSKFSTIAASFAFSLGTIIFFILFFNPPNNIHGVTEYIANSIDISKTFVNGTLNKGR